MKNYLKSVVTPDTVATVMNVNLLTLLTGYRINFSAVFFCTFQIVTSSLNSELVPIYC
jgi:hypothetical protein